MKRLWVMLLALWVTSAPAEVIDVKVYDAFGQSYKTVNIGESLASLYNLSFEPTMVLVLGPALSDSRVRQQEKILAGIDPQEHGILFAIGTPSETYSRGFNVAPNTAADLLPSNDAFRVLVIGAEGTVINRSQRVLKRQEVLSLAPADP